jgi:hypothetical protein
VVIAKLNIKSRRLTIINTWIGLSVLGAGITILLGSMFNIQNEKIFMAAMLAGVLIFSGFLIKSYARRDTRLDNNNNKGEQIARK